MAIKGINHVALRVRNLEESRRFFELLGFQQCGESPGMLFFRVGEEHHHHIALMEGGPRSRRRPRNSMGVVHYALTVGAEAELPRLSQKLSEAGYRVRSSTDHVVSRSLYVEDANGIVVELTYDVPRETWQDVKNPLASNRPYALPGVPDVPTSME